MARLHFMLLSLVLALSTHNVSAQEITIGFQASPSLTASYNKKELDASIYNTVKYFCEMAELDCTLKNYPLKRASRYLQNGQIDAYITIDNQQFRNCCISTLWYTPTFYGVFSNEDATYVPRHEKGFEGHSLVSISGSHSIRVMMPNLDQMVTDNRIQLYETHDSTSAIAMFLNNRTEYLWGPESYLQQIESAPINKRYKFLPLITRPIVIWFHQKHEKALDAFDQAFIDANNAGILNAQKILISDQ